MHIRFQSTVLITRCFEEMKRFYTGLLGQRVRLDFGNCVTLECALTLWKPIADCSLSRALGTEAFGTGNGSLEVCFETDDFNIEAARIKTDGVSLLHDVAEEPWGQRTLRFYDPDGNIVELGESIPCFCRRLHAQGLSDVAVSERTGVGIQAVREYIGT